MKPILFVGVLSATLMVALFSNLATALASPSHFPAASRQPDFYAPPDQAELQAAVDDVTLFPAVITLTDRMVGLQSIRAADLDRNGRQDVIVAERQQGRIVWFRNLNGTQFETRILAQANGAYMAVPADVNRDGRTDVVVVAVGVVDPSTAASEDGRAPAGAGALFWLENTWPGSDRFTRHDIAVNLNYPVNLHVADIDGNGAQDIVVATRDDNRITLYLSSGGRNPGFGASVVATNVMGAAGVHTGDIDGDGRQDLLAAGEDDNTIRWFRNLGGSAPTFEARTIRNGPPPPPERDYAKAVFAADIDGDGDLDVVFGSEQQNQVGWYENLGGGGAFAEHLLTASADHAKAVSAADVDRDGDMDVLAVSAFDDKVWVFENNGQSPPSFVARIVTAQANGAHSIQTVDIDADGDNDLLVAAREGGQALLYLNSATHRTAIYGPQTESIVGIYRSTRSVFASDLDKDGDQDFLSTSDNYVVWHRNDGGSPPRFSAFVIANNLVGGRWVTAADLDRDGDPDVITADTKSNTIAWYENRLARPGTLPVFVPRVVSKLALEPRTVHAADLDGDGDLDLYSSSDLDNAVTWYESNGAQPPTFQRRVVTTGALYARAAYAADVDGDGDIDLMSASANDNQVAWYENNGARPPVFTTRTLSRRMAGARHIHADDIDGDGDIDILSGSEYDHTIAWFENNGDSPPSFSLNIVTNNARGVHAVFTGDADQDGDIDIFAANETANSFVWYENNGAADPTFAPHVISANSLVAHGIYAADMDGDGDMDVLAASRGDGKVAWYENLGGQYAAAVTPLDLTGAQVEPHLVVAMTHKGRPGDASLRLSRIDLRFVDGTGAPLSSDVANSIFSRVTLYLDQGDGIFNQAQDRLLAVVESILLDGNGLLTIPLLAGDPNTLAAPGATTRFFAVAERNENGCSAPNGVRITNATGGASGAIVQNSRTFYPALAEYMRTVNASPDATNQLVVLINEVAPNNSAGFEDPDEPLEFPDWIELYNPTFSPISLGGLYLTDNPDNLTQFRIPDGITIAPRGYVVFIADDEPEQGPLHTNFKLSSDGEFVGLFSANERGIRTLDGVQFEQLWPDESYGRYPTGDSSWQILPAATPGAANVPVRFTQRVYLPLLTHRSACR